MVNLLRRYQTPLEKIFSFKGFLRKKRLALQRYHETPENGLGLWSFVEVFQCLGVFGLWRQNMVPSHQLLLVYKPQQLV